MSEEERYIFTEDDFHITVRPFEAVGYGNKFEWRLWNTYTDRSAGRAGEPYDTENEARAGGYIAAINEAERLNKLP